MLLLRIAVVLGALSLASARKLPPCSNYDSTKDSICSEIFQRLQQQIVGSDANLYSLRKVFYPTSQMEPTLVNVSYALTISSTVNRSCKGDSETPTNPCYDRLSPEEIPLLQVHAWTSKIFYTLFHPATVYRLQPQALQLLLSTIDNVYTHNPIPTELTWNTVGPILTVELTIDLQLPCWPTRYAVEENLNDLTSVLKVYADSQENVSSWGAEERTYALGNVFRDHWWNYTSVAYPHSNSLPWINVILSVILTLIISSGVYYALWNAAPANSEQKNFLFSYTVIWSGVAILVQVNFFLLLFEIVSIDKWCRYEGSCVETVGMSKIGWVIWMGVYMVIAFVVILVRVLVGKTPHREIFVPEWRAFVVSIPFVSTFILIPAIFYKLLVSPLLKVCKIRNLWIHLLETLYWLICCPRFFKTVLWRIIRFPAIYLLYMTVFVSASIFSFNIIPLLLQIFLHPFRIIAAYSFFFAAFAVYSLAVFMSTFLWKEKPPTTGKLILYFSSTTLALVFILIISVPFLSVYQLLVSGSLSDNPLILFVASVLPSLLLSSPLVWLFKSKLLPRFLEADEEEEEKDSDSDEEEKRKKKKKKKLEKMKEMEAAAEMESSDDAKIEIHTRRLI